MNELVIRFSYGTWILLPATSQVTMAELVGRGDDVTLYECCACFKEVCVNLG